MTERKPPRDTLMPPPLPQRLPLRPQPRAEPQTDQRAQPRLDTIRPGLDRPEDRPRTLGHAAQRQQVRPMPPRPAYAPNLPPVGRTSRSESEPRRGRWFGRIAIGLGALVLISSATVATLLYSPPIGLIRDQIIAQVKAKTGRDLIIAGPTALTFSSGLALSMRDLTLSGPPGMTADALATIGELTANVKLWPLLWGQISVDSLIVRQPVFTLRVDGKGKRNWDFAELTPAPLLQYAQAAPAKDAHLPDAVKDFVNNASDPDNPSPQVKAKLARLEDLTLGDVRIEDGTVRYRDDRSGSSTVVTQLETKIALATLASPLDAAGKLTYLGQPLAFTVKLASPKAIIEDRPAKLALMVSGAPVEFKYNGTLTARSTIDVDGNVTAKAASLRTLTAWLGHALPASDGYGPISYTGTLKAAASALSLNVETATLDGATASGTVSIDTATTRPRVNANLKISELDLNRYTLAAGKTLPTTQQPVTPPQAATGAKSIEDLINGGTTAPSSGPQVKGYTKRAGWSQDRIELAGLGVIDLDAKLAIGKLLYRELKIGSSLVTIALKNKVLKANFDDVQLYDGRGRGFISIDANAQPPVAGGNMSVDGVAAAAILKDLAGFERLSGSARMTVALGAQGNSEADLVATANGKADLAFTNGAIVGYNIPAVVRGLMQGKLNGFDQPTNDKTDFSDLTASFTIANGVATNQDMKLTGAVLQATGSGQIQLPAQTLDYTVNPKVSLPGQSGLSSALAGIDVPLRISGPWAKPQVGMSSVGIANAPKTLEAVKEIGRQLKNNEKVKEIGSALKGLLKDNPDGTKPDAKSIIDKLLKKKDPAAAN